MSQPANGNYYIVNRETSSDGTQLAITFNGEGSALTVIEKGSESTQQVWTIRQDTSTTQIITPLEASSLFTNGSSNNAIVADTAANGWNVRGTDGVYTIQNKGYTTYWSIKAANVGQEVYALAWDDSAMQNWQLVAYEDS